MLKKIVGTVWRKLTPSLRRKIVRLTQKSFTASAAAIVINEKNEVLLLDHVLRPVSGWGIPGGFLESGEQPEAAAVRELREETGIELSNVQLLNVRTSGGHVEIMFRATADSAAEITESREINRARWFKLGALPENMNRAQRAEIENLLRENS